MTSFYFRLFSVPSPQHINITHFTAHSCREVTLDSAVKESPPEGKRVKFNLEETRCVGDDNNPPLAVGEDNMGNASAIAGQDGDVITPHCDTVTGIQFP